MINTHCHLLPGLDDGPSELAQSLELALQLLRQGVSAVVCTPHLSRLYPVEHAAAVAALETCRGALAETGLDLRLHLAAEVTPERALEEPLESLRTRSLGGRFAFVEVVRSTPVQTLELVYERLAGDDLEVVFAHPERCGAVQRHPEALARLREAGALVQIVAPSLLGRWGSDTTSAAWQLLDGGLVDLLASDAHGILQRRPHLRAAADLVEQRYGEAARVSMTTTTPGRLLEVQGDALAADTPDTANGAR